MRSETLSYMGTKWALAPDIARIIQCARPGPVLDGFSGMCAVGEAVAPKRQIWSNDVQQFPAMVANLLFVAPDHPPRCAIVPQVLFDLYERNANALKRRFERLVAAEQEALAKASLRALLPPTVAARRMILSADSAGECAALRREPTSFPYRLFTLYYSGTYLSLGQCIELDSIVYALKQLPRPFTRGQVQWLFVALARAIQKVSTTTGHFAQYLDLKEESLSRYVRQRRRSIWEEWLECIPLKAPVGHVDWRRKNKVFQTDTLTLLPRLRRHVEMPAVVYADPPYKEDQYSRYYHLLETLLLYDYPIIEGKGRYRAGRFSTPFAIKSQVKAAFERLAAQTAQLKADLVLSYPSDGLLGTLSLSPYKVVRPFFRKVDLCRRISHNHSTLGASKGPASHSVTEYVYWARS